VNGGDLRLDLNTVLAHIETVTAARCPLSFAEMLGTMERIRQCCLRLQDLDCSMEGLFDGRAVRLLACARDFLADWELAFEEQYAATIAASSPPGAPDSVRQAYVDFYRSLTTVEVGAAKADSRTRVCHVGCGPMPLSVLMWHRYSGCRVLGIDRSRRAVETARRVLTHKVRTGPQGGLPPEIRVECLAGEMFDYARFDVVLLSSSVRPKREVLERIASTASAGVTVLERAPRGLWRALCQWEEAPCPSFDVHVVANVGTIEVRRLAPRTSPE
jgi:hypothetical protein